MEIFGANISYEANVFLQNNINKNPSLLEINELLYKTTGIIKFFNSEIELENFTNIIHEVNTVQEQNRAEYGDFQTNMELANTIVKQLITNGVLPETLIEPTCGKGNFIIASLNNFPGLKSVYGIEIYKPYIWETKFRILDFYLNRTVNDIPEIHIIQCSIFNFDFRQIATGHAAESILIIGNPPWVTNAKLSSLNSDNIPDKSNFKNHVGLDAITGKGNFDIAECITLMIFDSFQNSKGDFAFLVKNSVIKNIVFDQKKNKYRIGPLTKYDIDSKKEFNVSVEAAILLCKLNITPCFDCCEIDFYKQEKLKKFGWVGDKFVSNIDCYNDSKAIDNGCPFEWRQGLKHDCSSIMELDKVNGHYINGNKELVILEDNLVYALLKSSDLKNAAVNTTRKYTIVTQKKVGQETNYIKFDYPKTYNYLQGHQEIFEARKSSIYKNKPLFSIFGIGDYSFKPYKVAISGFYKTFHFTLILPLAGKPVMLDDTCYFLGFDNIEFAAYTTILLNSSLTKHFLEAITFPDAKRTFTKDVLMRIDLYTLATLLSYKNLEKEIAALNYKYNIDIGLSFWDKFMEEMKPIKNTQTALFA